MSFSTMLMQLSSGMVKSMGIFFWTIILSLPLGLFVSFGRMSKNPALKNIVKVYISVMRGTPLMLQLMIVYYCPFLLFGMNFLCPQSGISFIVLETFTFYLLFLR